MPELLTAVAHLVTRDAVALGDPRIDVLPHGVVLGGQEPIWSQRMPPAHSRDLDAYLRGLQALGWPPTGGPVVEVEYGHATVVVEVPAAMTAALRARPSAPAPAPGAVEDLADELGVDAGDVRVMLARLGVGEDAMTDLYGAAVRADLDQFCIRTVPAFWFPGADPDAGKGATRMTFHHERPPRPS